MGVIKKKTATRGTEGGVKFVCDVCSADITSTVCLVPFFLSASSLPAGLVARSLAYESRIESLATQHFDNSNIACV